MVSVKPCVVGKTIMKGIILAGGRGTRLLPLTKVTNKHLLPVYDRPMIYYPIETLARAGIYDIMIVTGPEYAGDFVNLLGDGNEFNAKFTYRLQQQAHGIADALKLCEDFADTKPVVVILGDNIFEDDFTNAIQQYDGTGAHIFLKSVADPHRFGVATLENDIIRSIIEKPKQPETDLAVTGLYIYDSNVWSIVKALTPSARGELEITDVNAWYVERRSMKHTIIEGFWSDAGTLESLQAASEYMRKKINRPRSS